MNIYLHIHRVAGVHRGSLCKLELHVAGRQDNQSINK